MVRGQTFERWTRLDVFGKTMSQCTRQRTSRGGAIFLAGICLVFFLLVKECSEWWSEGTQVTTEFSVDDGINEVHRLKLSMDFHKLSCDEVSIDLSSVYGTLTLNAQDNQGVEHVRLVDGQPSSPLSPDECRPCHDASSIQKCCNTCYDLRKAYDRAGLERSTARNQPQCQEGCRVSINTEVPTCSGSIRHVPGEAVPGVGQSASYDMDVKDMLAYGHDVSHTINSLEFVPSNQKDAESNHAMVMPLQESIQKMDPTDIRKYLYEVQFVPTEVKESGTIYRSHQYSVISNDQSLIVDSGTGNMRILGAPGFFLNYRFQPFRVRKYKPDNSVSKLIAPIMVLVGGAFALFDLFDTLTQKMKLGSKMG